MARGRMTRKLAAILAADMVGYSRHMAADEEGTISRQKAHRAQIIDPKITEYGGRIVKTTGDGLLAEFGSAVEAVRCATEILCMIVVREAESPEDRRIDYRVGINIADVVVENDDIYGDGVNVAARLEALADPGGICLSGKAYEEVRDRIAEKFEDGGEQHVKNIDRPLRVWRWTSAAKSQADSPHKTFEAPPLPDKPSIVVLPFDNMSGDPEQEYFADGLVEDITTTLSKLSGLAVIARNSSFAYKGRSVDVRQVARELGVRYVLEGSVRRGGNRMRITAQLIDAKTGTHVWAERFDREFEDIFAVQDEITMVLATEMQVKLTEGEQARIRYATTNNVAAWTHWAQGMAHFRQPVGKDTFGPARFCWEKAIALDPDSAVLNAMLGFMHYADARLGWWDSRATAIQKGHAYVDRALALDPDCPDAHSAYSMLLMLQERYDQAVSAARKASALAPGSSDIASWACFVFVASDLLDEAVVQIEKALKLSPTHPTSYLGHLGNVYRLAGRTDESIEVFRALHKRAPGFGLADLVIAYHEKGLLELAAKTAKELLGVRPNFTVESWLDTQFRRNNARLEADADALRIAGLP